jgi:hypothetical protein
VVVAASEGKEGNSTTGQYQQLDPYLSQSIDMAFAVYAWCRKVVLAEFGQRFGLLFLVQHVGVLQEWLGAGYANG